MRREATSRCPSDSLPRPYRSEQRGRTGTRGYLKWELRGSETSLVSWGTASGTTRRKIRSFCSLPPAKKNISRYFCSSDSSNFPNTEPELSPDVPQRNISPELMESISLLQGWEPSGEPAPFLHALKKGPTLSERSGRQRQSRLQVHSAAPDGGRHSGARRLPSRSTLTPSLGARVCHAPPFADRLAPR